MFTTTQKRLAYSIFVIAFAAVLGSLYFSNFGDPVQNLIDGVFFDRSRAFEPCNLCWWARILMYPIVAISAVGIWRQDKNFTNYVLPLVFLGMPLTFYHFILQMFPFETSAFCTLANPCNALQVTYFDFITIPFLAFTAFCTITTLCMSFRQNIRRDQ
ncbi:disulfide bond formation protein B [Candidatus Gracilibacteria bacterium]|jgi:disulfide bond formation protein DsbB|nr:disulfide bond formation protein B [Candidatus Gracilibacteria bacterium]